eukprot:gnl/TRDRNA2_/TRDRNA2_79412_c0_seq1.p1 gnl/TRDRNA2_/TRDRNA2_79412_c0~~gnl/TRDRNA2_/TRDRNA2_79412_c0_seq1.p1  ORF type:complete len:113 (-),score=1.38 gnl/TRDRNA2_/TRDRNA2_79412_c0_seq1:89-427(-)
MPSVPWLIPMVSHGFPHEVSALNVSLRASTCTLRNSEFCNTHKRSAEDELGDTAAPSASGVRLEHAVFVGSLLLLQLCSPPMVPRVRDMRFAKYKLCKHDMSCVYHKRRPLP